MGLKVSEEENHLIRLLAEDSAFFANARTYHSLILEWGRREGGDKSARPFAKISAALDRTVGARQRLPIVSSLGVDSRILGLAYQRALRSK